MRARAAIIAAIFAVGCPASSPAWADPCDGGLQLQDLPDGGPALPGVLCAGQVAPVDLVAMVPRRAAERAGELEASHNENKRLQAALEAAPAATPTAVIVAGGVALAVGLAVGFFLGKR